MKFSGFVTFTLFLLLIATGLQAQVTTRYLLYGAKDGLSQNSVHALLRDSEGLMWIGTQDGLNSFDGKNFTVYRHSDEDSNSISDQFILKIIEDKKGGLWIGTRNGLNYFNKRTQQFSRYYVSPEEQHQFQADYSKITMQDDGNLVLLRQLPYIFNANSHKFTAIVSPADSIAHWFIGHQYKLWALSADHQLFYYPDCRKKEVKLLGKLSPQISSLGDYLTALNGKDGKLYIYGEGIGKEIYCLNEKSAAIIKTISVPATINQLSQNQEGILVAATTKGIYQLDVNGHATMMTGGTLGNSNLPPGSILSVYQDPAGNNWVGTAGSGVAVRNKSFNNFELIKTTVPNDRVNGLAFAGNTLYMAAQSGLYKINNFNLDDAKKTPIPVLLNKHVTAIAIDEKQQAWIALQGEAIAVLNKQGHILKKIKLIENYSELQVFYMMTDRTNRIHISTNYGLFIATNINEPVTRFHPDEEKYSISGSYVLSSFQDEKNNIWIANNSGLDVFSESLNKLYSYASNTDKSSFLKRTIITSVAQDKDGAFWIATIRNGIYKLKNNRFSHYTHSSGLASDVIYNVVCDDFNRVWVTTSAGLNVFNQSDNAFNSLSAFDGIPNTAFSFGAALKYEGAILLGTSEGLLLCNSKDFTLKSTSINAYIADVKVNGSSIPVLQNQFEIVADQKLISFELASSPAFFSGNIIYQYRLNGLNNQWQQLSAGNHTISFTGLPYKKLEFQVRAAGSLNQLTDAAIYNISINSKPPIWKTKGFMIALGLLLVSFIIWIVVQWNKRKYKQQLQIMAVEKELQKERVRIGRDLHDNIGAYTSALIAGLNRIKTIDEREKEDVTNLKEYGANIMGFLRETIWMLNAEKLTVTAFADRFINYGQRISKNYPAIDFSFHEDIVQDKTLPPTVMLHLFRMLQEALQNACKHSAASKIAINISNNRHLFFEVADNGKGFTDVDKPGHYGIQNMRQRAAEAGFSVHFISTTDGTTVRIEENTANEPL